MGFNLGACAFRVSSLLYLLCLFFYSCFRFSLMAGGRESWGLLLRHAAEGAFKTRGSLEDGMDGLWDSGMIGWLGSWDEGYGA